MTLLQKEKLKKRICKECGKEWISYNHGGIKQFCSYSCANKYKWKFRERKVYPKRKCQNCGIEYQQNPHFSTMQWSQSKYCSIKCAMDSKKIKDGMSRSERWRRKKGMIKQHSPEWLEKIKSKTKDAMYKPEINFKLRQKRSPMSLDARIKISNALVGKMPKNMMFGSNHYPNVQRGDYENSKGTMYFRSKWEANYALYLDFLVEKGQIINWEYETDVFVFEEIKFGTRSYRPDFKVFNNDGTFEYHEVKGYMDSKSATKLKRMAKYYPEVKLILIDSSFYRSLQKQVGKMLNFY